ncbi:MAG: hypothetical protein K6360_04785 [Deltaproteobacteria bacterium]
MKKWLLILAMPALLACLPAGCAPRKPPLTPPPVQVFEPEGRLLAVEALSAQPEGMRAKGTVRLTLHGEAQPRIKGMLAWTRTDEGILLRATGIHLIGGTVFDLLVTGTDLYLSIPSHKAVYWADLATEGGFSSLRTEAVLLASPWGIARAPDVAASACPSPDRPGQVLCVNADTGGMSAAFDPATLAPLRLALPRMTASYGRTKDVNGLPYPTEVRVDLNRFDLTIEVGIQEIEPKVPGPGDPVFDPEVFQGLPGYPLSVLVDAAREAEERQKDKKGLTTEDTEKR